MTKANFIENFNNLSSRADYSKKLDDGSVVVLVPLGTYFIKKFENTSKDKIYTTDLVDCIGVTISDRTNNVVAFCHFHPINCLSKELAQKSLEAIKQEFISLGGNIDSTTLRIIGGQDARIRDNVINASSELFPGNQKINIDKKLFGQAGSQYQFIHGIITAQRSYIAKLQYKNPNPYIQNKSNINREDYDIVEILPTNKRDEFFTQCLDVKRSEQQNYFYTKALLMIKKSAVDLFRLSGHTIQDDEIIFYSLTPESYEPLLNPGTQLSLEYYRRGCGLVSVQNMAKMDHTRKTPSSTKYLN